MRNAFASEIFSLAQADERIVMLSADIGNRLFDEYKKKMPDRFYNCGVAEANMISMAAGLALAGMRPVAYTITPFITIRCLEQIKIDICYHNVPVVLVGTGSGLSYAELGPTHHSCDDIALLRTMPGMTIMCPADQVEAKLALKAALLHKGPSYIRIGKKGEKGMHSSLPDFKIGKAIVMKEGADVCLLSTGNMLSTASDTSDLLAASGISAQVVSFHTVKPLDKEFLQKAFSTFKLVVTLEEHGLIGGFGGAVAEWVVDEAIDSKKLLRMGVPDIYTHEAGSQEYFREKFGLVPEAISEKVKARLSL